MTRDKHVGGMVVTRQGYSTGGVEPRIHVPRRGRRPIAGPADRGSVSLELAILGPVLLVLLGLAIAAGRISIAGSAVEAAARDAAREASIARDPAAASATARSAALDSLNRQNLHCTDLAVTVDTRGFSRPVGQPAQVTAEVRCSVSLRDLAVPGLPGSKALKASSVSPLDNFRTRGR
jgi:Flp pilus assembly protein TadG